MKFEEELARGNFLISECPKCKISIWPPNEICNKCFGHVEWKNSSQIGKILEFSKEANRIFCLAELDNKIRVMGILNSESEPEIGQKVRLDKASIQDGNYHFEMSLS